MWELDRSWGTYGKWWHSRRWSDVCLPRRRGRASAAWRCGSRQRACDDIHAQVDGAVWHRGGIDGRPHKIYALVPPEDEDGSEEDGGGDFCNVCTGAAEGLLDRLCPLLAIGRLGVAFGLLMMCVGVLSEHTALFLATRFISVLGIANCR